LVVRPQPPFTSSARRAGARVNSKQRVCVRERVYSLLKRDVVRRTEEQSSLLCPQLPPSPPSLTFQFRLPVWLLPRRRPWRGKAERRVCAAKLRKSFGFACARVGWIVLVSVCTCVCCVRNESIWFPILWCITGETPLFCVWSLRASAGCIGNLLQSGWDPVVPSSFYRLPDVPTRGSPATASGGFG